MVKEIEELSPEVHIYTLADRNTLDEREICVHEIRPVERRAVGVPELTVRRFSETICIKPLLDSRVAALGIADLVGAIQADAVPLKVRARPVAVYDEERKPGSNFLDHVHFPIPEDGIDGSAPVATKLLTLSEGQIVGHAGGQLMVEVDLGESPIGVLISGQWEIRRAGGGSQTVRKSGVESAGVRVAN